MADPKPEAKQVARTLLALKDIDRLYARAGRLTPNQKTKLVDMLDEAEKALIHSIWETYRYVGTPGAEDKLDPNRDMGKQINRSGKGISDSIWDYLVERERLAPKIGASRLVSKEMQIWGNDQQSISKQLKEAFLSYPYLPMIPSIDVLRETLLQGVENGIFAYAKGVDGKFQMIKIGTRLESDMIEFDDGSYLLKPEEAYRLIGAPSPLGSEIGGGKQGGVGPGEN